MQWERMKSPEIEDAVTATGGVAIVPVGSLEQHGMHLPVGSDGLMIYECARRAAELDPAVLLPTMWYSDVAACANAPGAIALDLEHVLKHLMLICDEVARNGFTKIIIVNLHGGNRHILPHFVRRTLYHRRPYTVYVPVALYGGKEFDDVCQQSSHGHACECETSINMALQPELVGPLPDADSGNHAKRRLKDIMTAVDWYEAHPDHYCGDARAATKETGEQLVEVLVGRIVDVIRKVKADEDTPRLIRKFYSTAQQPRTLKSDSE